MEDKLIHTNKKLSPPVAYQLFSWDYRGAVAEKFSADSPRRILDRVKLAWQDAPQLVHRGYFELERKVLRIFASRHPDEPTTEPRKDFPGENCASGEVFESGVVRVEAGLEGEEGTASVPVLLEPA